MPTDTRNSLPRRSASLEVPCDDADQPQLTAKEVAAMLSVSLDTIYRHVPCIRVAPKTIRYSRSAIAEYLKTNALPFARRRRTPFARRKRRV